MKFDKRIALVSGGSQGIGEAIASHLAAEGASVAAIASSDLEKARRAVDRLPGGATKHMACVCDVRDAAAVDALVADVVRRYGRVDILVNSAGVFFPSPAGATTADTADRMIMRVVPPPLEPGVYKVEWRAMSADTHKINGDFTFKVGE